MLCKPPVTLLIIGLCVHHRAVIRKYWLKTTLKSTLFLPCFCLDVVVSVGKSTVRYRVWSIHIYQHTCTKIKSTFFLFAFLNSVFVGEMLIVIQQTERNNIDWRILSLDIFKYKLPNTSIHIYNLLTGLTFISSVIIFWMRNWFCGRSFEFECNSFETSLYFVECEFEIQWLVLS